MRVHCCRWIVGLSCLLATIAAQAEPNTDRCVVMISVDGLAGFYMDDPKAPMPNIRALAEKGVAASGMLCVFPTVTWPNHTTLVTGVAPAKHGVIGNSYFDRAIVQTVKLIADPIFDKSQIVRVPTIYDIAHKAGLSTAAVVWPATRNATTLDWTAPDMAGDGWSKYATQSWMAELNAAGLPVDQHGNWTGAKDGGVPRDELYTDMAVQLLQHHQPNLLLVHIIEVDHVEHAHGPRSPEAYQAIAHADNCVHTIFEAVAASPRADNTTIILVSDHGFFPIMREIRPNVLTKQLGLAQDADDAGAKQVWCTVQGGSCQVYILDSDNRAKIAAQLMQEFAQIEGVTAVLEPAQFAAVGQATPDVDPRAPDLWLSAQSGYSFNESAAGDAVVGPRSSTGGTHGYLPDHPDMLATLVLSGAGINPQGELGRVTNLQVAPTIARLLGLDMPTADGEPLTAALAP